MSAPEAKPFMQPGQKDSESSVPNAAEISMSPDAEGELHRTVPPSLLLLSSGVAVWLAVLGFYRFSDYFVYQLSRWGVCAAAIFAGWNHYKSGRIAAPPLLTVLAVIYNPLKPIALHELWPAVNILSALTFAGTAISPQWWAYLLLPCEPPAIAAGIPHPPAVPAPPETSNEEKESMLLKVLTADIGDWLLSIGSGKHQVFLRMLTRDLGDLLLNESIASDVVNAETGEIIIPANRKITQLMLVAIAQNHGRIDLNDGPDRTSIFRIIDRYRDALAELA